MFEFIGGMPDNRPPWQRGMGGGPPPMGPPPAMRGPPPGIRQYKLTLRIFEFFFFNQTISGAHWVKSCPHFHDKFMNIIFLTFALGFDMRNMPPRPPMPPPRGPPPRPPPQ